MYGTDHSVVTCGALGEFCLITLANYQSYTCFSLLSGMLLVSGRLVSQHMFIVNIIFTPQLPGIIYNPMVEDNDFILIIKVIADWITFNFPYLLCAQLKKKKIPPPLCTLVGSASLLWSSVLSELNLCLYAVSIKSHCVCRTVRCMREELYWVILTFNTPVQWNSQFQLRLSMNCDSLGTNWHTLSN